MWWFGKEARVVPENAEGHHCCRRGMNCYCAVGAHVRTSLARMGEGGLDATVACATARADWYGKYEPDNSFRML